MCPAQLVVQNTSIFDGTIKSLLQIRLRRRHRIHVLPQLSDYLCVCFRVSVSMPWSGTTTGTRIGLLTAPKRLNLRSEPLTCPPETCGVRFGLEAQWQRIMDSVELPRVCQNQVPFAVGRGGWGGRCRR